MKCQTWENAILSKWLFIQIKSDPDFQFDVWDNQNGSKNEIATVGTLYKDTIMSILRFYLASEENEDDNASSQFGNTMETDSLTELHSPPIQPTSLKNTEQNLSNEILPEAMQIVGIENDPDN